MLLTICVLLVATLWFAIKYYRQKSHIRLLAESLASRTMILTHSKEFRGTNKNWSQLISELNALIEDYNQLGRRSSGQRNQLETTLSSLQEGVLIVDRDNYILLVNKVLEDMFPSVRGQVGERLESCLRSAEFLEFVWKAKKGEGSMRREIAFSSRRGDIWLEVSAAQLADSLDNSNGPCFVFVLHDISALKHSEMARKEFVANASHELKTPVAVIKGYAETLVEDHEAMSAEDRFRFLSTIRRHSDRLTLLINDLLSLSQLESGMPHLEWAEVNMIPWVRDVLNDYRHNPRYEGGSFELDGDLSLEAYCRMDILKMRQVLDNILENAVKYSPPGSGVKVAIALSGPHVELSIQDEGPGVPEKDLKRIFQRFYRVDKGRSRETGGTGLGLSIVKHIVEWHDGSVWAENMERGGLRVAMQFPLVKRKAPVVAPVI